MRLSGDNLHIEFDDNGFIIGQSFIGDVITDEANVWREVRTDFSALSLDRSVSVEKGVLFRPEAAKLTLRAPGAEWMSGVFGRRVRVRWNNDVLFVGTCKAATLASQAQNEGDKTYMNITAIGSVEVAANYVLANFTAPQQTVAARVAQAMPAGLNMTATAISCNRVMASRAASNVKLMTVLQEAADAQLAKFYVDKNNNLVLDGSAPSSAVAVFSDNHSLPGHLCYRSVDMAEDQANTITGVAVSAKQNETITAVNRHPSAVLTHEETYSIDLPTVQNDVTAWAQSFPLQGYTRLEPSAIDTYWQDGLANLELCKIVQIGWKGGTYRAGIKGLNYDITPDREGNLNWNVKVDLMPSSLIEFSSVLVPSQPNNFTATATNATTVALSWTRPNLPNDMTGYMLRVLPGSVAPQATTEGTLVANVSNSTLTFSHTGRTSNTTYSYALFATTANSAVTSLPVTASVTTPEVIPTAPRNLVATRNNTTTQTLTWTAPVTPGDMTAYVLRYRTDGVDPTPTTGLLAATVPAGTTSQAFSNIMRNVNFRWGLFARTLLGAYSPGVFASQNTNESIPGGPVNLVATAPSSTTINLTWGQSVPSTDLDHYRIEYNVGGGVASPATVGSGTFMGDSLGTSFSKTDAQMDTWYNISVWPVTKGELYGARSIYSVKTPQGIFSKVWEDDCAWSQSYKSDNGISGAPGGGADAYYGYGDSFNGNQGSMIGWNVPGEIAGCYAVDKVYLRIYNKHTWNNSGADAFFGSHGASSAPSTFQPGKTSQAIYHMPKGDWIEVDVTGWLGPELKVGAKGIVLGRAPNNSTAYYGYAAGVGGPKPHLRVEYRTVGS